jgi:superfamily I DNA and/or RNA helicase
LKGPILSEGDLNQEILAVLRRSTGATAREIANELSVERRSVNQYLHEHKGNTVCRDESFRWYVLDRQNTQPTALSKDVPHDRLSAVAAESAHVEPPSQIASTEDLIGSVLESLRRRLLDLTSRNRLLHFRHPKTSSIRVIDEMPDQLKQYLADDEKEMRFTAIPDPTRAELIEAGYIEIDPETEEETSKGEPTAKEWAEWKGIHTNYEAPEVSRLGSESEQHQDNAIQTMFFPHELEMRLRNMRQKANSAIEEAGANILYLAIGFLEWFEDNDSAAKRLAPLYMIPVRLDRGRLNTETRTYEYRLKYSGEDILTNISLREKLRNDFQIALPELEDGVDPEEYIKSVAQAVRAREPNWRTRRFVSLCHLNFSKQLLYLDLDPERWPAGDNIKDHPLIRQCLAGLSTEEKDDGGVGGFGKEHPIDDIKNVHEKYPLIDDADSSQHSALIDAIEGKNLVIEGPPGTGKSQTITNLIAAAIANGKRVLFVAEKAAALEVVKRRLDQAGLGEFCLELHSHRSQKRRVLDDMSDRIKLTGRIRKPANIQSDIDYFEELKDKLRQHAELVNSRWKQTHLTIHEILSSATRFRQELSVEPERLHPTSINGDSFTPVERKRVVGQARTLATVFEGLLEQLGDADSISAHPWYGVTNTELQAYEHEQVVSALTAWQKALLQVSAELDKLAHAVDCTADQLPKQLKSIQLLVQVVHSLPDCDRSEPLFALPRLKERDAERFGKGLHLYIAIQNYFEELSRSLAQQVLEDPKAIKAVSDSVEWLSDPSASNLKLLQLGEALELAKSVARAVLDLVEPMRQTNDSLRLSGDSAFEVTLNGLKGFEQLAAIVSSLKPEYLAHRDECFDQDELDRAIPQLTSEYDELHAEIADLEEVFDLQSVPDIERLKEVELEYRQASVFSWLSGAWRSARRDLRACKANKKVRGAELENRLADLVKHFRSRSEFESNLDYKRLLRNHFQGLDTDISRISNLRAWYRRVREEYGAGFGSRVAIGDATIGISEPLARALRSIVKQGLKLEVQKIDDGLKALSQMFSGAAGLASRTERLDQKNSSLAVLSSGLARVCPIIQSAFTDKQLTVAEAISIVRKLHNLLEYADQWRSLDLCNRYLDGKVVLRIGVGATDENVLAGLQRLAAIATALVSKQFPAPVAQKLYKEPTRATLELIKMRNRMLGEAFADAITKKTAFSDVVELDEEAWKESTNDELGPLLERNPRAIESPEWLGSWLDYIRARSALEKMGWKGVADAIERGGIEPEQVKGAIMLGASDQLAREILKESPQLSQFSGLTQRGIQQQFQEYDNKLRDLQRQLIAWKASRATPPRGKASGRVREYTELSLLEHEIGKKTRHIPLRQLVRRAGQAISSLKPCFMMGPMSVAQYLAPGEIKFDLIVMDEASQVRPEDALGAVARGDQLVVVGDPKQLPPTSFFDKLLDEEDEEEDFTAGQQSESILDAALTTFPARRLRWHYRSQHESLIAFSNHAYYGSDLVIFPSPINKAPEFGVQFTRVKSGRFINRVNREEAALIAKAVRQHMVTRHDESIGVVAMSAQQREQIERAIEQESKEDAEFRDWLDRDQGSTEPLFVKNLENVQGDERDVIYISMTYGPTEVGGRVAQRFGPINTIHGWRRLNVLLTRSKKRMHVFSSMGADDIVVSPSSSRGVKSLKEFLEYAATGNLTTTNYFTDRDPDSDFEVAVAHALSNHGYECVPQVGVAGYFLDIAVKDPGNPGRFLMAIECDGATYHSAKSTRDRDRLRQTILERLGWRVRRIWSTDWFSNPGGQLAPIIQELDERKTIPAPVEEAEPDELEEIEDLAEELEEDTEFVSTIVQSDEDLQTQLEKFDREVIRKEHPNTKDSRRFLRPAMLDALLLYLPTTIWEFQQQVPPYLRQGTDPAEGEYIKPVMEIIYASEG